MKKIIFGMLIIIAIVIACCAVYSIEGQLIRTTLISQEPDPVDPGGYTDLRFKVENIGDNSISDVTIKIIPEYPFSLDPGEQAEQLIGSLLPRQKAESGVIVKYKIRVDKDAVEGENTIRLAYKIPGEDWVEKEFTVNIRTADIVLSIDSVDSTPEVIPQGKTVKVAIKLTNLADSLIRDIRVKLDLSSSATPFVPIKSTTEKKLYQIGSRQSDTLVFDLMANPDAKSGVYKIPVNFTYYDTVGTQYTKSDIISLIIGTKPDLFVGIDASKIYKKETSGKVTFKFVNKGLINIKFLNVKLGQSDKYETVSPAEVYVGNIDSDDFETVDFDLYVNGGSSEEIIFPVTIEYMDANNNEFKETINVGLKLYSTEEAIKVGLEEKPAIGIFIIIAIVIIGLFIFWRIRKRKKSKR